MKTIQVTNFIRPNGRKEIITITNINPEDADYIIENKIHVSMEDIEIDYCIWFDDGTRTEDDEPDEIIVLSQGRSCQESIAEGVIELKARKLITQ